MSRYLTTAYPHGLLDPVLYLSYYMYSIIRKLLSPVIPARIFKQEYAAGMRKSSAHVNSQLMANNRVLTGS